MRSPNGSKVSVSTGAPVGTGTTAPLSACGLTNSFLAAGGVAGGVGGAAPFFEPKEPTWSFPLYFLRMPSLWYFQNCFDASLPATRVRIFLPPVEDSLLDFGPSFGWKSGRAEEGNHTWMLICKGSQIVDIFIHNDIEIIGLIVRRHVRLRKGLRHLACTPCCNILYYTKPIYCSKRERSMKKVIGSLMDIKKRIAVGLAGVVAGSVSQVKSCFRFHMFGIPTPSPTLSPDRTSALLLALLLVVKVRGLLHTRSCVALGVIREGVIRQGRICM